MPEDNPKLPRRRTPDERRVISEETMDFIRKASANVQPPTEAFKKAMSEQTHKIILDK